MKTLLVHYLVVGAAGCFGAMARLAVGSACGRLFRTEFPVGTLVVNLTGSFLLGWFVTIAGTRIVPDTLRLGVAVGFVGAYTTFSTFMFESNALAADGAGVKAIGNLVGSIVLGLIALRLGIWLGQR